MRSVKQLVKELLRERPLEYEAFANLGDSVEELLGRIARLEKKNLQYFCRAERTTTLVVPATTGTPVPFTSNCYPQLGNIHDASIDNQYFYIRRDGVYDLSFGVYWETLGVEVAGAAIQHRIRILRNGAYINVLNEILKPIPLIADRMSASTPFYCYVNDRVELWVYHNIAPSFDLLTDPAQAITFFTVSERREDLAPDLLGLLNPDELIS